MSEFDLNLSTRPFPAYRLTNLLLIVALAALIVITAWQAYGFSRYSSLAGQIRDNERTARVESEALGKRLGELETQLNKPEAAAKLTEIGFLNDLIARKSFSWTRVFADLEDLVPNDVHLTSLRPEINPDGPILMHIDLHGRDIEAVSHFVTALEDSPAFDNVIVIVEQKDDPTAPKDIEVSLTVNYSPEKENQ
jgi:type IV pilus assembly protein PilN